ncbi:MAG: META domain-containing protein [Bacteroidetes bacterium]|nr:META domain-containing protein [Bacteroidota bacterium]
MKQYIVAVIALLFLGSCSHKTIAVEAVKNDLSGIWQIISVNGIEVVKKDAGKEMPYLEFNAEKSTVTGTTGCNRLNGKATINNNSINFGPLATTMMMCQNAKYERPILQTLIGNLSYTYERGIITISKEGRTIMTLGR